MLDTIVVQARPVIKLKLKNPASQSIRQTNTAKPILSTIAPGILNKIFDHLDPCASACLGVTSKRFYNIHSSRHGPVDLYEGSDTGELQSDKKLFRLLKKWMGEQYYFCRGRKCFLPARGNCRGRPRKKCRCWMCWNMWEIGKWCIGGRWRRGWRGTEICECSRISGTIEALTHPAVE